MHRKPQRLEARIMRPEQELVEDQGAITSHCPADAGPASSRTQIERMTVMQEVLSWPGESEKPVNKQKYWVLEIFDWTDSYLPGFIVQQACGRWSEIDRQFIFDEIETDKLPTLTEAEKRYETRRSALLKKGFILSDMEF